jgi:hypothetical protein
MGNPVTYAEDTLKVHAVWVEAQSRLDTHARLVTERVQTLRDLRAVREEISDRKLELASDPAAAGSSHAERERNLKALVSADHTVRTLQAQEADLMATVDMADAELKHHEVGLRVLAARMTELGGLLQFYASRKPHQAVVQPIPAPPRPPSTQTER